MIGAAFLLILTGCFIGFGFEAGREVFKAIVESMKNEKQ